MYELATGKVKSTGFWGSQSTVRVTAERNLTSDIFY